MIQFLAGNLFDKKLQWRIRKREKNHLFHSHHTPQQSTNDSLDRCFFFLNEKADEILPSSEGDEVFFLHWPAEAGAMLDMLYSEGAASMESPSLTKNAYRY